MARAGGAATGAAFLALGAAFLWAAYYPLVLGVHPPAAPSGLLALPFLVGGAGFAAYAVATGRTSSFARQWTDPRSWGRAGLLAGMQIGVLASTYLAGAVDTSLLSLVGDVVATPVLLAVIYREGAERFRLPAFVGGVAVCAAGAALTIVAGGAARPLSAEAVPVAIAVPILIALYFLFVARASLRTPTSALAGHAGLGAGIFVVAISPLLPGGLGGLRPPTGDATLDVVAIGLTTFFLAPSLYFRAIERAGLILPSVLMAAIPIFTVLLAWTVLGIVPPALALAGIPVAVSGALLALRGEHAPWVPEYPDPPAGLSAPRTP